MAEKSRTKESIFGRWLNNRNLVGGWWSVVVLVGGRWFLRSVVGYCLVKWSVVDGAWSVVCATVVGGMCHCGRWLCTTPVLE